MSLETLAQDELFMAMAIEEANRSRRSGEFPFGCVIVRRGELFLRAENMEARTHDVTAHAEIMAVKETCIKLGRRDLSDCTIYSSAEPCPMCSAAIFQANIGRVVFGLYREDLPNLFRERRIRIAQLAEDWDYLPEVVGGVLRQDAVASFDGIDVPWRVKGEFHQHKRTT